MTDKKNETENDPTLQEDTFEADESASNEEWQGELPPEDDFHDQEIGAEDVMDETLSDEAITEETEDATAQVEKAKRSKTVLFGSFIVGILFIGGMAYLQFGATGSGPDQFSTIPASNMLNVAELQNRTPSSAPSNIPAQNSDTSANTRTASVDLDKMYSEGARSGSKAALPNGENPDLVMEKPVMGTSSDVLSSSSDKQLVPPPVPTMKTPVEAKGVEGVSPSRSVDMPVPAIHASELKSVPVALGGFDPLSAKQPAPVAANAPSAETEARLKDMMAQIDTLKKSLSDSATQNASLVARIEALQQENAAAKAKAAIAIAQPVVISSASSSFDHATEAQVASEPQATQAKPTKPAKAAVKKTALTKKKAEKPARWVLRAATPDAAWVSVSRESTDLRRIAIGESLPGLGKVKQIKQNGSSWEVVGSSGVLK